MWVFELAVIFLAVVYILSQTGWPNDKRQIMLLLLISVAAWLAEESSIRLYHFYAYHPQWRLFISRIPLVVLVVWAAVVHSAWDLSSQLCRNHGKRIPLVTGAIVLADAALIEVVAVRSGLWAWTTPGVFQVPLIGILGWAFFAFFCAWLLQRAGKDYPKILFLLMPVLPVVATHILLLATWWGVLRWRSGAVHPLFAAAAAWTVSLILVFMIFKKRPGRSIKRKTLLWRLPAAMFFFVLLAVHGRNDVGLVLFTLAFAPPYLALLFDAEGSIAKATSPSGGMVEK